MKQEPDEDTRFTDLQQSALFTFESLFGAVYHGTEDSDNAGGLDLIAKIKGTPTRDERVPLLVCCYLLPVF